MQKALRVLSYVFALLCFSFAFLVTVKPLMYANVPTFILVVGVSVFLMVFKHGKGAFDFYLKTGPDKNQMIDKWTRVLYSSAIASSLYGVVDLLASMHDPMKIGPALAIALLSVLYAAIIKLFLLEPFRELENGQ